jgi:hypothetical protein
MSTLKTDNIESLDTGRVIEVDSLSDRQDLANDASGSGASLVSMEGGPTVEVAVLDRVIRVTSTAEGFAGRNVIDGFSYRTNGWQAGYTEGANDYKADSTQVKSGHNGGSIISPTVPAVSLQAGANLSERTANYLAGTGETDSGGLGCFVSTSPELLWVSQFGSISDDDSFDSYAMFEASLSIQGTALFKNEVRVSQPVVLSTGKAIFGTSKNQDIIRPHTNYSSGTSTVTMAGTESQIAQCSVYGGGAAADAILVNGGKIATIRDVRVKFATRGIHLVVGNSQRWYNVLAESNDYGFYIEPDGGNNTNGCYGSGLRAYNSSEWGFYVEKGGSSVGHMHSTWDVSAEGGNNGIYIDGGRYCHYILYAESNTGKNYDLKNAANYYFVKNPDNDFIEVLSDTGTGVGIKTSGASIFGETSRFHHTRVVDKAFAYSDSIDGGAGKVFVTNTSGGTLSMNFRFVDQSMRVGDFVEIYKADDTAGFNYTVPAGYTLLGSTSGLAFVQSGYSMVRVTLLKDNNVWVENIAIPA